MAPFLDRRCKHSVEDVQAAVDGAISREQAAKRRECLLHIDQLNGHRETIETEILRLAQPYSHQLELLRTVPGFSAAPLTAVALISEIALRCDLQISGIRVAPQTRLHLQGRGVCRFRLTPFPILFLPQALRLRCCALFRDTRNSYVVSNFIPLKTIYANLRLLLQNQTASCVIYTARPTVCKSRQRSSTANLTT